MQQKHLFEYAVIRVVPRVEREEFLNVGVILYCAKLKFLEAHYHLDERRLLAFCKDCDIEELRSQICSFEHICREIMTADLSVNWIWLHASGGLLRPVVPCCKPQRFTQGLPKIRLKH